MIREREREREKERNKVETETETERKKAETERKRQRQREKDRDKELDTCKAWVAQLVLNKLLGFRYKLISHCLPILMDTICDSSVIFFFIRFQKTNSNSTLIKNNIASETA